MKRYRKVAMLLPAVLLVMLLSACGGGKNTDGEKIYTSIDDLKYAKVGTLLGSCHVNYVQTDLPTADLKQFDSHPDGLEALRLGKIDAYVQDDIEYKMASADDPALCLLASWHPAQVAFAFPKVGGASLKDEVNEFLRQKKASGAIDSLYDKWINHVETAQMPEERPLSKGSRVIKVGFAPLSYGVNFVREGRPAGYEIELVELFAAEHGYGVEFKNINFGGIIAALSSGMIDMAACSMNVTEERKEKVDFSDTYLDNCSYVIINSKNAPDSLKKNVAPVEEKNFWERTKEGFVKNLVVENRYRLIVDGLWNTLVISLCAIMLGALLGAGVCAMRMSRQGWLRGIAKTYIDIVRGIPVLVLLMLLFYVAFAKSSMSAVVVAVIAFSINFSAYVSEMFRSSIEAIDRGQTEAALASGFKPVQAFRYVVLPQAVKRVLPVFKGEAVSLFKNTSVVGYIAVQDLTKASDIIRSCTFDAFFPLIVISIIYFLLAWALGKLLDVLGNRI